MVSPNLIKKHADGPVVDINNNTKKLFQVIYNEQKEDSGAEDDTPKIKVSTLVSKVAFFYEKVRNAVDYDEEHLLRKNAIDRILRRQVMIEGVIKTSDSEVLANNLMIELIRGSYLPNNKVPETKIKEVTDLLQKYILLKNQVVLRVNSELDLKQDISKAKDLLNEKNKLIRWLLTLAACEIEENLGFDKTKQVIVNSIFSVLTKNTQLPNGSEYEKDLEIQIYLSICRTYLKLDRSMLSLVLFKYYNSAWLELNKKRSLGVEEEKEIKKIARNIQGLSRLIDEQLNHPLAKQLDRMTRLYSVYFSILSEAIETDPTKVYTDLQNNEGHFTSLIRKVCNTKYKKAKKKLWRAAIRSIIYIFLTKSLFAVAIEVPAIQWFGEELNVLSLAINIAFPATLLFFIVLLARMPSGANTDKIIDGIKEISFLGKEKKRPKILRQPVKRRWLVGGAFHVIYTASLFVSIYFIIWALGKIDFNWVSITIFLFFLAFVSFFSILVTKGIKELTVLERRENLFTFLTDIFYMPIIIVGRWLSRNFSRINIFIFIFDFIIEAPFKILMEIGEDWTKYVRERRENMEE